MKPPLAKHFASPHMAPLSETSLSLTIHSHSLTPHLRSTSTNHYYHHLQQQYNSPACTLTLQQHAQEKTGVAQTHLRATPSWATSHKLTGLLRRQRGQNKKPKAKPGPVGRRQSTDSVRIPWSKWDATPCMCVCELFAEPKSQR